MATRGRMPWEQKKLWPSGEYTLLVDAHTAENGVTYSEGDILTLNQWEATRLGNAGSIAPPRSMYAVRARAESGRGTARDEYLCQIGELTGAWEDRGRT